MCIRDRDVSFVTADYLRDQEHVINTFIERIGETVSGPKPVLTLMEDFKQRLERGEVDVHHHHAEFQPHEHDHADGHEHGHGHSHGKDHEHSHSHSHSHSHDHDQAEDKVVSTAGDSSSDKTPARRKRSQGHSHAPYRHIAHTHGPRTMINENICCCFMSQFPQYIIDEELKVKPERPGTPRCKRD